MTAFVESLPIGPVQAAAKRDAIAVLTELLARQDASDLHGFAICTISDATSAYWSAETNQQLRVRIDELLKRNHQLDPTSRLTDAEASAICCFEPADWGIKDTPNRPASLDELNDALDIHWTRFEELPDSDEKILVHAPAASRAVLHAIGYGLRAAKTQIDWSPIGSPDNVALLVWVNDPDDPEVVCEIARQLNPTETFARFSTNYFPPD